MDSTLGEQRRVRDYRNIREISAARAAHLRQELVGRVCQIRDALWARAALRAIVAEADLDGLRLSAANDLVATSSNQKNLGAERFRVHLRRVRWSQTGPRT